MRWPWQKRDLETGGRQARVRAEQALKETQAQTEEFAELARDLREIRRQNHLALAFLRAAGGKRA